MRKIKADLKKKGITEENINEAVIPQDFSKLTSLYQMLMTRTDLLYKKQKRKKKGQVPS